MANIVDPDQTAPIGAVCSGSMLFSSILNSSVMLGNYLQQTTFSDAFFLGTLRVKYLRMNFFSAWPKLYLKNEFNFSNVHGIMNTSGLLQSK